MTTSSIYPVATGQRSEGLTTYHSDINDTIDRALTDWGTVQTASATVTSSTNCAVAFSSAPTAGNLLVCAIAIESNVRCSIDTGTYKWTEIVDAGATGRGIAMYWRREGENSNTTGTTSQPFTAASNVTGKVYMWEFSGPYAQYQQSSGIDTWTSGATSRSYTLLTRDKTRHPRLRVAVCALNSGGSAITMSGGDASSQVFSSGRQAFYLDKEDETSTALTDGDTPSAHAWSWTGSVTGSAITYEFGGEGITSLTNDDSTFYVGYYGLVTSEYRAGLLFDTASLPDYDTISGASLRFCLQDKDAIGTGDSLLVVEGKVADGTSAFGGTTTYSQVMQARTSISGSTLGSMVKANMVEGTAAYNDLNGSSGLNSDTALKATINKTGTTSVLAVLSPTTDSSYPAQSLATVYGVGTVGTDSDPLLVVTHHSIGPSGFADGQAFGTPTVDLAAGGQTISPSSLVDGQAFGTATVTPGTVTVSPTGLADGQAFGTVTVTPGEVTASPSSLVDGQVFGTPTVDVASAFPQTVEPSGLADGPTFGSVTVTPGEVTVGPAGFAAGLSFGVPLVGDLANTCVLVVQVADQVAVGLAAPIVTQALSALGVAQPFDATPTVRVYSIDPSTGTETDEVASAAMGQIGATDSWSYSWVPSAAGTFVVSVVGECAGVVRVEAVSVSARPKFDPVALALYGQLVSRF